MQPTGLTSHPYIAASGDGLVGKTVIEIKCPFSSKEGTIDILFSKMANGTLINSCLIIVMAHEDK